jgi:hypothetical protein
MTGETLVVVRAPFDMEEPWSTPAGCSPVRLRRATDAAPPRLATSVAAFYDDEYLSILFSSSDDLVRSTLFAHDAPLYEEDVVEIFITPDVLERYYELEVSPRGTVFDARVDSPGGERATMHVDRAWNCEGLIAAVRRITESGGAITLDTVVRIPFAALGRPTPHPGKTWRIDFCRVDRHSEHGDEYSAWQATQRTPPDVHVPAAFGILRFG